jgi:hypothetical protein
VLPACGQFQQDERLILASSLPCDSPLALEKRRLRYAGQPSELIGLTALEWGRREF